MTAVDSIPTVVCCRVFPVAGPTVWNSLPNELRDLMHSYDSSKQFLDAILF